MARKKLGKKAGRNAVVRKANREKEDYYLKKIGEKLKKPVENSEDSNKASFSRVKTGIQGFDDLIEGGIPANSLCLVTGGTGTGKTTFGINFLVEGAKRGEAGVYVSLERESEASILEMGMFGWDLKALVKQKAISIIQPEMYDFDKLVTQIEDAVSKVNAKRLVIDSSSLIGLYFKDEFKVRRAMIDLERLVKRLNCTSIAVNEIKEGKKALSSFGVEEFVADGVIVLYFQKKENAFSRGIAIRKMRLTNHSMKIHPMQIKKPGGIIVYPSEEVFTEF